MVILQKQQRPFDLHNFGSAAQLSPAAPDPRKSAGTIVVALRARFQTVFVA